MRKWALTIAAIAAVFGIVVSAISTSQHLRIAKHGLEEQSFCAVSEKINCDIVNASSYAEFLSVPVAWWGLAFYVLIALFTFFAIFSKKERRGTVSFTWFLSIAALIYSSYLAYIAMAVLGVVCVECLALYAVNILLFVFLFVALKMNIGAIPHFVVDYVKAILGKAAKTSFLPQIGVHIFVAALIFFIAWVSIGAIKSNMGFGEDEVTADEVVKAFYMQSLNMLEPDPNWPVWGNPKAKVSIIEFSEFKCPFCKVAAFNVKPHLYEFKNDVRYYFVNYPLDKTCNKDMENQIHEGACFAAKAGVCANKKGDFWKFHDDMFRDQKKLSDDFILGLAKKRGWDVDEFKKCIDSDEAEAQIQKDMAAARKIFVSSTPSFFINERKFRYWQSPKFLNAVIEEEVKKAKK